MFNLNPQAFKCVDKYAFYRKENKSPKMYLDCFTRKVKDPVCF